jgi:hypothetical protein
MKTLKAIAVLCIIFGLYLDSVKAQVSQKMSYKKANGITSILIVNWDTIYNRVNISEFNLTNLRVPAWIDITKRPQLTFIATSRNNFDLINKPTLFYGTWITLTGKPAVAGFPNTDMVSDIRAILTRQPTFGTSRYYIQSTKTNEPSFSDNLFYRAAGHIFNVYKGMKYPILSSPKK